MRRLLVDHARRHRSAKRGSADRGIPLDQVGELAAAGRDPDLIALDEALTGLAAFDPLKASIVELRYIGGLSHQETARFLNRSRATVLAVLHATTTVSGSVLSTSSPATRQIRSIRSGSFHAP